MTECPQNEPCPAPPSAPIRALLSPLARRVVLSIIVVSSIITLSISAVQIHQHYREERAGLDAIFAQIEQVHLEALGEAIWTANRRELELHVEGLARLPGMEYIALFAHDRLAGEAGRRTSLRSLERRYPITHLDAGRLLTVGALVASAGIDPLRHRVLQEALIIVAGNAVAAFLVAGCAFFFFYLLVNRHLVQITKRLRALDFRAPAADFTLRRAKHERPDELDELADALNVMSRHASAAMSASRESEERFRQMAEHISDVFWMVDPASGRMLYVSPGYETIWGRTCKSLYEAPGAWLEAIHPDDRERVRRASADKEAAGTYNEIYRIVRPDGGIRWIHDRGFPVRDGAGRVYRVTGVATDITVQKEAEDANARLAAIVQSSNDAIIGRTPEGIITSWNSGAERMLGYAAQEAIGRLATFMAPPDTTPRLHATTAKLLRGEAVAPYESQRMTKDGRLIDVLTSHSPIKDRAGNVIAAATILKDISALKDAERESKASEQRFRAIFDYAGVGITMRSAHSRAAPWVAVNDHFCKLLGYSREELANLSTADITCPEEQESAQRDNESLRCGEMSNYVREKQIIGRNGRRIWVNLAVAALPSGEGHRPESLISVYQDISERKRAETERNRLAEIVEHSSEAIVSRALDDTILSWNPSAERMFGWSAEEAIGQRIAIIVPPERRGEMRPIIARVMAGETIGAIESRHRRKDGTRIDTSVTLSAMRNAAGEVEFVSLFYRDITAEKQAQAKVDYLSHHDALTGLPNRALFHDRLERALAQARRRGEMLGVLMVNIDRFSKLNEGLGVDGGDALLAAVAQRMSASLRDADTIARFGGDEFAVLVEGAASADEITVVAEKLDQGYGTSFTVRDREVFVAASIGIAVYPDGTGNPDVLLQHAEAAMRELKKDGGNGYALYDADRKPDDVQHIDLESRLRRAVENGELELQYQAKVSADSGAIAGAEALVRWRHPELGLVSPAHFIPLAEETGLILPIGEWVLDTACREADAWRKAGYELHIAVNLSPRQFRDKHLVRIVADALEASGLEPRSLELEITETAALSRPEHAEALLKSLRGIGVRIALDDFGTGHSSLSHLRRLPLDAVKIDRSFVQNVATNAQDRAIVSGVTALAHNLGMHITAEGVEDGVQLEAIRQCGCDTYQGYHFSRPLPAAEFRALLAQSRTYAAAPHPQETPPLLAA